MMEKNAKIYVAGHRGMVGSAIVRELERQGYTNIITRTHKELDLRRIHYHEITVFGSYGCTSLQNRLAVELLLSHKIRADWLITRRVSLSQIDRALDHSARRAGMKSVVCF